MSYTFKKTNIFKEFVYILYNLRLQYLNIIYHMWLS